MPMLTIAHDCSRFAGGCCFPVEVVCALEDLRGTFQDLCSRLLTFAHTSYEQTANK